MKTRLATSLALAAAVTLGLTGCGLVAPQATLDPYSPSDGIEVTIADVDVRNLMLITDAEARELNVVFTAVNNSQSSQTVGFRFENSKGSSSASADFRLDPGTTRFGGPEGEATIISMTGVEAGSMITVYVQGAGGDVERQVPVIDGTLQDADGAYAFPEYRELVP
ncbi:MAG: DNA modification methylase [Candidatus Leucobacter sulfamidivorax]|nr:DNA modification methylase [Candidatus Leucobacter sulfamidivorax]